MNQEVRQKLVEKWISPDDVQYLDEAIENINARRSKQYQYKYDITKPERVRRWEYVFTESNDPYDADIDVTIDDTIVLLNEFKINGYSYVGYEDDELIAYCYEPETASERAQHIKGDIIKEINSIKKSRDTREQKLDKIMKLTKQIEKLKEELKEYEKL